MGGYWTKADPDTLSTYENFFGPVPAKAVERERAEEDKRETKRLRKQYVDDLEETVTLLHQKLRRSQRTATIFEWTTWALAFGVVLLLVLLLA